MVLVLQSGINHAILPFSFNSHGFRGAVGLPCAGGSAVVGWIHEIGVGAVPRQVVLTNSTLE
jgi:hypothetical protein